MSKKRLPILILAMLAVITLMLPASAFAASVSISTRSCTSYFQVYNGTEWHDYTAPQHYITGSSPEQVAYCMQQTKASPSSTSYTTNDVLGSYSAHTNLGLQIIIENGYPFSTPSGLTAAEARYATANAIRFWLAEEGDDYQYNYDDFSAYTDAQLRTYAAAGKIGSKVRTVSSSYSDILQFSIELLIAARSQTVPPHTITFSPSTLNLTLSNGYFTGTTTVTLNNMEGGYTLNSSALPSGSSVSGFTGNNGDVLTVKIPVSAANSNKTISLSATGYDDRTRTNIFAYAPSSSSYQKMLTATVGDSYMENVGSASLSVKTPAMPDLIVSSLTTDSSSYGAGDTVTITATVKNQGTAAASSFSVQLAPGTLVKQTANIASLAVGASQSVTFTFTAPVYTADMAMTLAAMADSADTVDELDESNNSRSASITVLAARPDLDITALSTNKSAYDAGETVTVTATVKNIGFVSAPSHVLRLIPDSLTVQDKTVGALAPGASSTVTYTFTAPIKTTDTTMTLTVSADPANLIAEADETNNTASKSISIRAGLPDLTITALTTDKSSYDAGETVTVTATAKNIGLVSAPSHILRLTPGSLTVQNKTVVALAPGASSTVTYTFTAPINTTDTTMMLTVAADPANLIAEENESNNTASVNISVAAGLPDLDVTALSTNKSAYDAGETVTVTATVKNIGLVSAPSHTLRLTPGSLTVQNKTVGALAPGTSATVTYTFAAPINTTDTTMTLTVAADPANLIAEADETNNTASKSISIGAGLPDLDITALSTDKTSYEAGETVTVTATVKNIGLVSAPSHILRLTPGSLTVQNKAVGALAPRASATVTYTFTAPIITTASSMTLTIAADPANLIAEEDESNNTASVNISIAAGLPDLTITTLSTNKSSYDAGETVTVTATVKNIGLVSAPSHILRLTPSSLTVQNKTVGALASGASATVSYTFTAPIITTASSMTLTVAADPTNQIAEEDESNNTASVSVTIGAGLPDLVVTALSTNKSTYDSGETATVTATVKNIGLVSAPSHTLRLTPGSLTVQNKTVGALAPGASSTVTYTFTAPINTMASSVTLTVAADPANLIAEEDESNNTASVSISIEAGLPDLIVTALSTNKSAYDAGETVTVTATVKNIGLISAPIHTLRLTPGSLTVQNKTVGALAPGASSTVTYIFTPPTLTSTSSITLTVVADPANLIAEDDEANNTASVSITIAAGLPDLVVTALSTNKSAYDAGEIVIVTAMVTNQGVTAAGAFTVQLAPGTLAKQTANIASLAVNASQAVTFTFTTPTYASDTSLTLTVTADSGNTIMELDEANNTRSVSLTFKAAKPDLMITSLITDKASYDAGDTVTATAVVKNTGYASVSSCEVLLTPGSLTALTKITGVISTGGSVSVMFTCTIPAGTPSGDMLLKAVADPNNKIAEVDESNNSRTYTIGIDKSVPDLTVKTLIADKQTYEAGETVTVSATVTNQGDADVSTCDVRLVPDSLSAITKTTGSLAANGGSTVVTFTFTVPAQFTAFSMTLTATADPDNKIAESDETNNGRSVSISVNAARPDITVVDADTADWYAGYDVLVSATVKNLTSQPVPSVKIRLKAGSVQVDETICVPANSSNLAVFRFTVPTPPNLHGTMPLTVTITADPDNAIAEANESNNTWIKTQTVFYTPTSIVVDPDSQELEQDNLNRNKATPTLPQFSPSTFHTWQEVRLESGSYVVKNFWVQLDTIFSISPDPRIAYLDNPKLMESGFGVQATCKTTLMTNYDHPEKLIGPQMVWVYHPESAYGQGQLQNVRDSLETSSGSSGDKVIQWQYAVNPYSETQSRLHYTPLWFSDGQYTALAQAFYAWSPVGQMINYETDSVTINGDMYDRIAVVRR